MVRKLIFFFLLAKVFFVCDARASHFYAKLFQEALASQSHFDFEGTWVLKGLAQKVGHRQWLEVAYLIGESDIRLECGELDCSLKRVEERIDRDWTPWECRGNQDIVLCHSYHQNLRDEEYYCFEEEQRKSDGCRFSSAL
jgi:hypothetical protein